MEKELENILTRWQAKVILVKKGIEQDSAVSHAKVIADLTEKYMQLIFEKSRQAVEIARVKEEIET